MKLDFKVVFTFLVLILSSCGSIITISYDDPATNIKQEQEQEVKVESKATKISGCEGCSVIPKSGLNKDQRYGYYFDKGVGKCVRISYSTGPGCTPPPFRTYEECARCCGGSW